MRQNGQVDVYLEHSSRQEADVEIHGTRFLNLNSNTILSPVTPKEDGALNSCTKLGLKAFVSIFWADSLALQTKDDEAE